MRFKWFALIAALAVGTFIFSPSKTYAAAPQDRTYVQDQGGWDAPPAEFKDVQRQGFHDGIEAARKDFDHHRPPDVNIRDEYRHPHVDHAMRDDYREGFRRGYDVAMQHLMGGGPH